MPQREIDNPTKPATGICERWLYQHYGKKPSATFDRWLFGNRLASPCCRASGICNWCQNGRGLPGAQLVGGLSHALARRGKVLCCAA